MATGQGACQSGGPKPKAKGTTRFTISKRICWAVESSVRSNISTARWWLAEVADKRIHGTTKKTPLELHAQEVPHLLPLPALQFDTAQVVYRVVDTEGTIQAASNRYSVPHKRVADLLPVRSSIRAGGLQPRANGDRTTRSVPWSNWPCCIDPSHLSSRDHAAQMESLRERYTTLGEAVEFLDGLLARARYSKHHAQKILNCSMSIPRAMC
ncbi:MAG: hypothetical protein R3C09_20385 [Pirellulaceae bacterium]